MRKTGVINVTMVAFEDVDMKHIQDNEEVMNALRQVTMHSVKRCAEDVVDIFDKNDGKVIPVSVKDHVIMCNEGVDLVYKPEFVETAKELNDFYQTINGERNPNFGKGTALCMNNMIGFTHMKENGLADMLKDMKTNYGRTIYNITLLVNPDVARGLMMYRDDVLASTLIKHGFDDINNLSEADRTFISHKVNTAVLKFPTYAHLGIALDKAADIMSDFSFNVYTTVFLTTTDKISDEDLTNAEYLDDYSEYDDDDEPFDAFAVDEDEFDAPPYKYLN